MPRLCSFSVTEAASLLEVVVSSDVGGCAALLPLDLLPSSVVLVSGALVEGRRFEEESALGAEVPGCLKIPKLIERLWGCSEYEMV